MFNEDIKSRFIKSYSDSVNTRTMCETLFNSFEKYEIEWGADLCTKTKEELQPIVDSLLGLRVQSKATKLVILKDYVQWCICMKIPQACEGMLSIDSFGVDKIRTKMVSSPLMLQMYLNNICDSEQEQTVDNIYRCYYWLAYMGVDDKDIINIKYEDVDFTNLIVKCNGSLYPLFRESLPAFKICAKATEFVYKHPNYVSDQPVYMNRAPGDTLMRGIRNTYTIEAMRVALSKRTKERLNNGVTTIRLNYSGARMSGMFYRKYEQEIAGLGVDFIDEALEFTSGKNYKLGANLPEAKVRRVAKSYMEDYQRWKLAFKL